VGKGGQNLGICSPGFKINISRIKELNVSNTHTNYKALLNQLNSLK
jgi:hypothetical protein